MAGNTGFQFKYNLAGRTSGIQRSFIIAASKTIAVGDMIKLTGGLVNLAGANAPIMGVVVGLTDKNGTDLKNTKLSMAQAVYTESTRSVVTGNANHTGDQIRAIVDVDPLSVWTGETDNASTDAESRLAGCYTDIVAASNQADDDTATTTQMQLFIWGADPESDTTKKANLYSIAEHQLWGA
jgi:hypothetical protein